MTIKEILQETERQLIELKKEVQTHQHIINAIHTKMNELEKAAFDSMNLTKGDKIVIRYTRRDGRITRGIFIDGGFNGFRFYDVDEPESDHYYKGWGYARDLLAVGWDDFAEIVAENTKEE